MTVNGKRKGDETERVVQRELQKAIGNQHGMEFKRNPYEQAREKNHSDIVFDNPLWCFAVEVKRRKSGNFKQEWMDQAAEAAKVTNQFPVVIYRFDHQQFQVAMRLGDLIQMYFGKNSDFDDLNTENVTISLSCFFVIAKEVFGDVKRDPQRFARKKCPDCDGSGEVEKTIKDPSGFPYEIDVMVKCPECEGAGLC